MHFFACVLMSLALGAHAQAATQDAGVASDAARAGRAARASLAAPTPSPSGALLLELVPSEELRANRKWKYLSFRVLTRDGRVLFEPRHRWAAWFTVIIAWDAEDRIWVRSSDEGVCVWAQEGTSWKKYYWQADQPVRPSPERVVWDADAEIYVPVIGGPLPETMHPAAERRSRPR
jgi:hypothetical protein